jgi:hypothetical protein
LNQYCSQTPLKSFFNSIDPKPTCGDLLLDHFVGAGEQRWWHFEPKRLRSLEVDDQLELGRLFDGEVGGARALRMRST